MEKKIFVTGLSNQAWQLFNKERIFWIVATIPYFLVPGLFGLLDYWFTVHELTIQLCNMIFQSVYLTILYKNACEQVYGIKLNFISMMPSFVWASLFFTMLFFYTELFIFVIRECAILNFLESSILLELGKWIVCFMLIYLYARCAFVGIILLKEKTTLFHALMKSFKVTRFHVFLICAMSVYRFSAVVLSALIVIGVIFVFPYTILLNTLLCKELEKIR